MINKSNLFISPLLTNVSLRYSNDNYVAEKLLPIVQVKKDTGQIATYGMDNLRVANSLRAQGASTNEINHTISTGAHYILEEHSIKELVTKEEMENADKPISPKIDAVENLMDRMLVIKERSLATALSATATMTQNTTLAGTDQWNDYANSDPIGDLQTGIDAVRSGSGKRANTLLFAYNTFAQLVHHPDFVNRAQGAVVVTADVVSQLLKSTFPFIKNVIIADAQYNSGVEGGADALAELWDKVALVLYIEPRPSLKSRSLGFTYSKGASRQVDEITMASGGEAWDRKGDFVRVTDKYDQKLVDVTCGYLVKAAIA